MTPAAQQLLAALHAPDGGSETLLARLDASEWEAVAALAIDQRVGALLYSRHKLPFGPAARERLRAHALHAARCTLQQMGAVRALADSVAPRGITLTILKGVHLATSVYASPSMREMDDIDILVSERDIETVAAHAHDIGYRPVTGPYATHHLPVMTRHEVALELHWQIDSREDAHGMSIGVEDLHPIPALAPNITGLVPEALLVHLCIHAADRHVFESGLRALCDVQAVLARYGHALDWSRVDAYSRAWRGTRSVALVLSLCNDHLGVSTPTRRETPAQHQPCAEVRDQAMAQLFAGTPPSSEAAAQFTTADIGDKLRILTHRVTRPTGESLAKRVSHLIARHGRWLIDANLTSTRHWQQALERRTALATWLRDERQ